MDNEKLGDFVTVQEAAQELQVTEGTVRTALSEGRLPFATRYGRKLIARADLAVYAKRTRPDGTKPTGRPKKTDPST